MPGNVCYICLDGGGALTSQFSCRGTSGHVHEACLLESFKSRRNWMDLKCRQCKHEYYGKPGVELATIALEKVQEEHGEGSAASASAMILLAPVGIVTTHAIHKVAADAASAE